MPAVTWTVTEPVLKPGEVFEYMSTAPLSVRPIGTTIIAARMKGEYKNIVLDEAQETATPEQMKTGGDQSDELVMFHFVSPDSQRVKPVVKRDEEDDKDDDDDDYDNDDDNDAPVAATVAKPVAPASATAADASAW
jgi:hypothetical protein